VGDARLCLAERARARLVLGSGFHSDGPTPPKVSGAVMYDKAVWKGAR